MSTKGKKRVNEDIPDGTSKKIKLKELPPEESEEEEGGEGEGESEPESFLDEQEEDIEIEQQFDDPTVEIEKSALVIRMQEPTLKKDEVSNIFDDGKKDFSYLELKKDHEIRPLWIAPDGHIFLESFSPIYQQAYDFLIAIAEPVSRPEYIHEYLLTSFSLLAASSVGLQTNDIIDVLNRLSKIPVPKSLIDFIKNCTSSYGKLKLVLKDSRYWLESADAELLASLLRDPVIRNCQRIRDTEEQIVQSAAPTRKNVMISGIDGVKKDDNNDGKPGSSKDPGVAEDIYEALDLNNDDEDDGTESKVHSFEVADEEVETLKHHLLKTNPVVEEYDFRNDRDNPNLEIDLKPSTVIRPYQEKSLSKMFGDGRARSGIIVLPCGAGKTLVGITAACTIKKSILVLCTSAVSVDQWKQQFLMWTTLKDTQVSKFTSHEKGNWKDFKHAAGVTISTYTMVAYSGKRAEEAVKMMEFLQSTEWGLLLLDEVHVAPAAVFRKVLSSLRAHCKLGLTATLLREDHKIGELNYLIGPKLYEANWLDLSKNGFIANVQCAEVWCKMTPEFYAEYLNRTNDSRRRKLLYVMNPDKFKACQYLIKIHEQRGDKIIVFSDDVFALKYYAQTLSKPFIYGPVSQAERRRVLDNFQRNPNCNCIFLSKVGDTSIDLPEATCLIQISSHFGSRRQEAQRLGRILRAKKRHEQGFNAFFYTLVSQDTQEMYYSSKRQQFLIDQGYAFHVITDLEGIDQQKDLIAVSEKDQLDILQRVLSISADELAKDEKEDDDGGGKAKDNIEDYAAKTAKKKTGNISGGSGLVYEEFHRPRNEFFKDKKKKQVQAQAQAQSQNQNQK